ncbi:hypothetical protein IQ266_02725, partial [filamentous cyanobacterium LEGE 11480]
HALLGASDRAGRNAWFEACEEIGEPAIFVQDVKRGWELAEKLYAQERERAIVLQGRYALIAGTLKALLDNLPVGVMAEFVKGGFWSVERAWAYVEQMQEPQKIAEAIQALATYFTQPLRKMALEAARQIQSESSRASVFRTLAQIDQADFAQLLEAARQIQSESSRASVFSTLAQIDQADFAQLLEAARQIQSESSRASVFSTLAQSDQAYFTEALEAARQIQSESSRASVFRTLAQSSNCPKDCRPKVYQAILKLTHRPTRVKTLSDSLEQLPLTTLPYDNWKSYLHPLADRKRADLMGDLVTLYPAICHLGGEGAMRGIVDEMQRICGQWP